MKWEFACTDNWSKAHSLGEEGWELAAVTPGSQDHWYYLKRPLEEESFKKEELATWHCPECKKTYEPEQQCRICVFNMLPRSKIIPTPGECPSCMHRLGHSHESFIP